MQTRKVIFIIIACIVSALIFLYALPMRRTYKASITVNANNIITNRTIADTANWFNWYNNQSRDKGIFQQFEITVGKKHDNFNYTIQTGTDLKRGMIQLTRTNKWNTEVTWIEETEIHEGITHKLNLLLKPSQFREPFFENIVQFKNHIEHPDSIFAGLTFENIEIPENKVVIKNDTIAVSELENAILKSYKEIITTIPESYIKEPGNFLSQYEKLSDSTMVLSVAVEINEPGEEDKIKTPFELAELESHKAVVMHTSRNYTDIDTDVSIMYEWLKKKNVRPATSFWVKHNPGKNIAMQSSDNRLTIIQEVYSLQ